MLEKLGLAPDAINFISYDGGAPMCTALAGNQVTFSLIAALGSSVIADYRAFITEGQIGGDWMGPEATTASLEESFAAYSQYIDALE